MIPSKQMIRSIIEKHDKPFYILNGCEYGLKDKAIQQLIKFYNGEKYEYPDVMSVIELMNKRHLVPLKPAVYIVRYDESFPSILNEQIAQKVKKTKMIGTLICLYGDGKYTSKFDKYFPDNVGQIDSVDSKFIRTYLEQDFPNLNNRYITIAVKSASNYSHARTICKSLSNADPSVIAKMGDSSLQHLFGCSHESADFEIRLGVASRNFGALVRALNGYEGDKQSLYYVILQTMIDLEKILTSKYSDLDIKEYAKEWKMADVYYMFMHTYDALVNSRSSNMSADIDSSLINLFALLTFKSIPSVEALNDF